MLSLLDFCLMYLVWQLSIGESRPRISQTHVQRQRGDTLMSLMSLADLQRLWAVGVPSVPTKSLEAQNLGSLNSLQLTYEWLTFLTACMCRIFSRGQSQESLYIKNIFHQDLAKLWKLCLYFSMFQTELITKETYTTANRQCFLIILFLLLFILFSEC